MSKKFHETKRGSFFIFMITLIIGMMATTELSMAQTNGRIIGQVTDAKTGNFLPGANIVLEGTALGTASDRAGMYRIENVTPGTYTLKVIYVGYNEFSASVEVTAGGTVSQDASMEGSYIEGEEILVEGLRQGQAKALSQQKIASNIKNVVDQEQMKKFPDINSAEVLQRIPGIALQRDQGEGRYVQIRGTPSRMNSMKVNGENIPSPEGGERTAQMDIIPADQLASIEVIKAITPDMDANAIGGAVNLVTKSALDYEEPVFNVTAGGGYADILGRGIYQASANYGTKFGENENFGIMLSASYLRSDRGSHNNEMEWGSVDDANDNEIPWALENISLRHYDVRRDRLGFATSFDYKPDNDNFYSIKAIYDDFLDIETRNELTVEPDGFNTATDVTEAEFAHEMKTRDQSATLYSIMGTGENHFDAFKLDYSLSYNYAEEKEDRHFEPKFEMDETPDMTWNLSDRDNPQFSLTSLDQSYYLDPANYVLDGMEYHDNITTNTDIIGSVNLEMPYSFMGSQAKLKFGGKFSMKDKDRNEKIWDYEWDGSDDILMTQFTGDNESELLDGNYNFGPLIDPEKMEDFFNANKNGDFVGEINVEDSDAATYDATEDIYAFYIQTTLNFDDLQILAGIRDEMTETSYNGNIVEFDTAGDYVGTNPLSASKSHNHFLPSLHLKYTVSPQTNIRAAFTSGLARPHYEHMVPYSVVLHEDEEIERGNADLIPTTAYSFDLLGEHYLPGIGIASGGVFYKILDDIIYPTVIEEDGGIYDGYEVSQPWQPEGADPATIFGIEVNWQQQLTFLPGFLNGFGIYANYTYTESTADLPGREDATLPGQAGNTANFALSYQKAGFTAQFSMNYQDSFIFEVGEDEDHDVYYKDHVQFDFSANQEITDCLSAYLQLVNLNNAPLNYYIGKEDRPIQREFYSWWMTTGLKYEF